MLLIVLVFRSFFIHPMFCCERWIILLIRSSIIDISVLDRLDEQCWLPFLLKGMSKFSRINGRWTAHVFKTSLVSYNSLKCKFTSNKNFLSMGQALCDYKWSHFAIRNDSDQIIWSLLAHSLNSVWALNKTKISKQKNASCLLAVEKVQNMQFITC